MLPTLVMPSARLGSDKYPVYRSSDLIEPGVEPRLRNPQTGTREADGGGDGGSNSGGNGANITWPVFCFV